jgi:hypothetical protein
VAARAAADLLDHYLELRKKVIDQTERRVFQEESVPATEKIVSIFEPHTDVIVKDRRDTLYGHRFFSTSEPRAWSSTCCWSAAIPPTPREPCRCSSVSA